MPFFFDIPSLDPLSLSAPVMMIDGETGTQPGKENAEITAVVNQVRRTASYPQWRGCNLVGGGAQGSWERWTGANVATRHPGQGPQTPKDYTFPTAADVDYLISKGMNVFRLLFNHEAIQPEAFADIPYNGDLPNPTRYRTYYNTFKALVDYITITKGKTCLIDIHNAEGKFPEGWVAYYLRQFSMTPTASQEDGRVLADLWGKLATIFINNPLVWFGIHNEPTTSAAQWYPVAQAVIDAIRGTDNTNKIVMPGINATGARDWFQNGADTGWEDLDDDRVGNMVVQIHTYYDPDNSGKAQIAPNTTYLPDTFNGSPATATNLGQARLTYLTNWARARGKQVFIGELALCQLDHGADQTAQMIATWRNTVDFINANADVIIGYAWWEYGNPGWADNIFDLRQASGVDNPRMNIIKADFVSSVSGGGVRPLRGFSPNAPIWKPRDFKGSRLHSLNFTPNRRFYLRQAVGLRDGATHFATFKHIATDVVSAQAVNAPMTVFGYNADPQIFSAGFSAGIARYVYGFPFDPYPDTQYTGKKFTVTSNNGTQTDWVLVPKSYDTTHNTPMTLFVWLHGCEGYSENDVNMVSTGAAQSWISLAVGGREDQCWASLALDGSKVLAAIDYIRSRFNIHPGKIVLGGYSSGGDLGYALAFQNSELFSGVIFENTAPNTVAMNLAKTAKNKFHIAQMVHTSDTTFKPVEVRPKMNTLRGLGFQVEIFAGDSVLEKPGSHFDGNSQHSYDIPSTCTSAHLRTFMLPFLDAGWVGPGGSLSSLKNYDSAVSDLNDGKTHTVCWTHSAAGVLKVYVDGVLNNSWAGVNYNSRALLNIIGGGYKDTDCYSGSLAEAISYNGVLTDQNVRDLHSRATQKWF